MTCEFFNVVGCDRPIIRAGGSCVTYRLYVLNVVDFEEGRKPGVPEEKPSEHKRH